MGLTQTKEKRKNNTTPAQFLSFNSCEHPLVVSLIESDNEITFIQTIQQLFS